MPHLEMWHRNATHYITTYRNSVYLVMTIKILFYYNPAIINFMLIAYPHIKIEPPSVNPQIKIVLKYSQGNAYPMLTIDF